MVKKQKKSKISNEFLSRLKRYEPDKILRVILLMNFKAKKTNRRLSFAERQAIIKKIRRSTRLKVKLKK